MVDTALGALRALHGYPPQEQVLTVEGATEPRKAGALDGQIFQGTDLSAFAGYQEDEAVGADSLAALQALAQELVMCERGVADANAAAVAAAKRLADVQEQRLPDLMQKHGMKRFDFLDTFTGIKRVIKLVEGWSVAMPPKSGKTADPQWQEKHQRIYEWLTSIGKGGIIKKDFEASFGLMSDSAVAEIAAEFKAAHPEVDVSIKKFVEPATLRALVGRMKDDGTNVAVDLKVTPVREARVSAK